MKKRILLLLAVVVSLCTAKAQTYKVGDIYDKDGLKGLVIRVNETGEHGLIMSLDRCTKKWASKKVKYNTNCFFEDDGEKNMKALEESIKENGLSWEQFPLFSWCRSKGDGWYIPAKEELEDLYKAINGGVGEYDSSKFNAIDEKLKSNGGDQMYSKTLGQLGDPLHMYSSTEGEMGMVHVVLFTSSMKGAFAPSLGLFASKKDKVKNIDGSFKWMEYYKNQGGGLAGFGSRAVHKF